MNNEMLSPYQRLIAAGVVIEHYKSDLYCPKTAETTAILKSVSKSVFVNRRTGTPWYDVPFTYDPFWEDRKNDVR